MRARHQRTAGGGTVHRPRQLQDHQRQLGHAAGDDLLQAVAARLDAVVRDVDALGRLGGDEFVVVVADMSPGARPAALAERLLDALKEAFPARRGQTPISVTASIGIASGDRSPPPTSCTMPTSRCTGRSAMGKQPLRRVRGRHAGASPDADSQLEMDLRVALDDDEFFLEYQPTFGLEDMQPHRDRGAGPLAAARARRRAAERLHPARSRTPA